MKTSFMKSPYLLASVSGLLIGTSYIPFPPWAIFFAFIPLWIAWSQETSYKQVFWTGWITQFVLTLIGFNWVSYTVHEFGNLPWPAAILALVGYASFANLFIPLAGVTWLFACRRLNLSGSLKLWALPLCTAIGERLFPMIFDWHFGYTWLWAKLPAYHLADIFGIMGLSTIGLFFNGCFLQAYTNYLNRKRYAALLLIVPAGFLALNLWGYWHGQRIPQPDSRMRVLVVQANISNEDKVAAELGPNYSRFVIDRFLGLTENAIRNQQQPVDFVVWPETAFPEMITDPTLSYGHASYMKRRITPLNISLITGGYSLLPSTNQYTNSFFILDPQGNWATPPYHKTILLAFGEYFPLGNWFPFLPRMFPEVGNYGRGPGPTVLDSPVAKVGAQICYEGLFDWFSRQLAQKGAQVLINLTNDGWYGTWMQPYQHLYMTLSRAIEVRRPLVRSTNTGISAVILASGEILSLSPLEQEWTQVYDVPFQSRPTITTFQSWGFWIFPALLFLGLIGLTLFATRGAKRNP